MQVEQGLGWSILDSPQLVEETLEEIKIRVCWVNGEVQDVNFYVCHPTVCHDMNQ
jgi:hypothetical protein